MSNEKKVLEVLKNSAEPLRPGDIALKAEISKADTDKAIQQLKKNDLIISPKRCFYAIK
jgi:DNA-binding MarR family transcriptional regulator